MSGFAFHLKCETCGLESPNYPYRAEDLVSPSEVVLPAADSSEKQFKLVHLRLPTEQIKSFLSNEKAATERVSHLASASSKGGLLVAIPILEEDGPVFVPQIACPRCGSLSIRSGWGSPGSGEPRSIQCVSLEEAINAAFSKPVEDIVVRLPTGVTVSRMQMFGKDEPFRWTVTDVRGGSLTVAEELAKELRRRGISFGSIQPRTSSSVIQELELKDTEKGNTDAVE